MSNLDFDILADLEAQKAKAEEERKNIEKKIQAMADDENYKRVSAVKQDLKKLIDEGIISPENMAKMLGLKVKTPTPPKAYIHPVSGAVYETGNFGVTKVGKQIKAYMDKHYPKLKFTASMLQVEKNDKGEFVPANLKVLGKKTVYTEEQKKVIEHFKDKKNEAEAKEITRLTADLDLKRLDGVEEESEEGKDEAE